MSRTVKDGEYHFEFLPTGRKLLEAICRQRTPNICLCGGFGSSKTRTLCEIAWELGCIYKELLSGIFRKTRVSLKATTYHDFIYDTVPEEYILEHNKSDLQVVTNTKSQYNFYGIDRFVRKGSLKFDIIFVDEAIELDMDDIVMLQGRLRGHVLRVPVLVFLTNAGAPGMPLHELFVQNDALPKLKQKEINLFTSYLPDGHKTYHDTDEYRKIEQRIIDKEVSDPDFLYLEANSYENIHNPPAYFYRLDKWKGTPYYDRFVLAKWTAFEGLVYGTVWDPAVHVIPAFEIPFDWNKRVVIDFGYTVQHPLVIMWIAINPVTRIKYVYRQYYMSGVLLRFALTECKNITEEAGETIERIVCDHDAEGRAQVDHDWMDSTTAVKDIDAGIQSTTELLMSRRTDGMRGVYIFDNSMSDVQGFQYGLVKKDVLLEEYKLPTCLQEEMGRYIWGLNNKPKPEFDHACDCLRYDEQTDRWGEFVPELGDGSKMGTRRRTKR